MIDARARDAVKRTKAGRTGTSLPSWIAADCVAGACDEKVRKSRQIIIQGSTFDRRDAGLGSGRIKVRARTFSELQ